MSRSSKNPPERGPSQIILWAGRKQPMAVQGPELESKDKRSKQRRAGLRKRARSKVGLGRRVGERVGEGGVAMGDELELGGAAGHVAGVGGDHPEADVLLGAGPSVGGGFELDGG